MPCHMCEAVLIKRARKGLRWELKVSPQIAKVTNSDLIHTRVWEKDGGEGEKVGEKLRQRDDSEGTKRSLRILHNQQQSVLNITVHG